MKKILFIVMLMLSFSSITFAQSLVIDGETCTKTTKTSISIHTINEQVKNKVLAKFPNLKQYTVEIKKDRLGTYYNYVFRFKLDQQQLIESWLKSI